MRFYQRASGHPSRLGILPGTFNPITVAHVALGRAALTLVDEVVFTLPRALPHKQFTGASFDERIAMLRAALAGEAGFSIAATDGGLFAEIAKECRAEYGEGVRLSLLCGRDAAERAANWEYGESGAFAEMLREFDMLVAARGGEYEADPKIGFAVRRLAVEGAFEHISATEVRIRIANGEPWSELVPGPIVEMVKAIYGTKLPGNAEK